MRRRLRPPRSSTSRSSSARNARTAATRSRPSCSGSTSPTGSRSRTHPRSASRAFPDDTLVRRALESLAAEAGVEPRWQARIAKQIPVAARPRRRQLGRRDRAPPRQRDARPSLFRRTTLHELAAELGADVPFFLTSGPQLAEGDGTELTQLDLPQDYWVLLLLPSGAHKESTESVYAAFDARAGADGYDERRARPRRSARRGAAATRPRGLPPNDLASSPLRRRAARPGRVPRRRQRRRAGRLRPLRTTRASTRRAARDRAARPHMADRSRLVRLRHGDRQAARGGHDRASHTRSAAGCACGASGSRSGSP